MPSLRLKSKKQVGKTIQKTILLAPNSTQTSVEIKKVGVIKSLSLESLLPKKVVAVKKVWPTE